jgi:2'-5' RNA ligase
MTYSIWLVPSAVDSKCLNKIIQNLAKKYNAPKFSAHITVFSGVRNFGKAKSAALSLRHSAIRAQKTGIGHSDYLWKTLFLKIKKSRALSELYTDLQASLDTKYDFEPHISLVYKKLDQSTKRKIISDLKTKKSFRFDKLVIIRSSKSVHKWKRLYTVRLNATGHA